MELPLQLKVATLVLSKFLGNAQEHIAAIVSDFLVSDIPLTKTIELSHVGSLALLDLVWTRSLRDAESSQWTEAKLLRSEIYYYKWEFSLALVQVIRRCDLSMVQWILHHISDCLAEKEVVEEAARGGHLRSLQLLESDKPHGGIEWGDECLVEAAKKGNWNVVRWLHQRTGTRTLRYGDNVTEYAFYQCNVQQLKWTTAKGFILSDYARAYNCDETKREACWEVVRYILDQGHGHTGCFVESALVQAAKVGDVNFTKWLLTHYVTSPDVFDDTDHMILSHALEAAGKYGSVQVLECIATHLKHFNLPHDPSKAMYEAAKSRKLVVVQWLVNHYSDDADVDLFRGRSHRRYATRTMRPVTVMDVAARHGHLEVLKFLHQVDASQRKKRKREDRDMFPTRENCRSVQIGSWM